MALTSSSKTGAPMIWLVFLMALILPFSAASSDTGLVCAIDMGSNTFKLILGEMQEGNYVQHHFTKTRLGVGDDMSKTGVISPPKLKEIRQTLQKYLVICESKGISTIAAVATAAFREAKNQDDVVEIASSLICLWKSSLKNANHSWSIWWVRLRSRTLRSSTTEVVQLN
jgi:hypothetical protein